MEAGLQSYLLAAGQGRRAGGPKAWREHEGKSLLERQVGFLRGVVPEGDIAVSIQPGWEGRCAAISSKVRWVPVDPEAPALASVLALARVLPLDRWTFVHHVDMRVWEPGLFSSLARAAAGAEAVVPVQGGRRGHPVLLSPALQESLLALDPARDRLDVWLRSRRVVEVPLPFPCMHDNWNTP